MEKFNEADIKSVSLASTTLYVWGTATNKFQIVKKKVAPLERDLEEALKNLAIVEKALNLKMAALKEI